MDSSNVSELRKFIINSLNEIQKELPTEQLVAEGVHIWPIIKYELFFIAFYTLGKQNLQTDVSIQRNQSENIFHKILKKIKVTYRFFYLTKFYSKQQQTLTTGSWSHRVLDNGVWLNRYYINMSKDRVHIEFSSLDDEYLALKNNIDLKNNTFFAEELLYFNEHYFYNQEQVKLDDSEVLKKIIDLFNSKLNLNIGYSTFNRKIAKIFSWADLWQKILNGIKPKEIRMLCYQGTAMYGLCIAGNRKSIPVIDIQHGAQGDLHAAYCNFGIIPQEACSAIPTHFSVWNLDSKQHLEKQQIVKTENILLEGNSWIEYNKNRFRQNINKQENTIVYALQTTVEIPQFMLDAIKESAINFKWILKPHPRMTIEEMEKIKHNLSDLINQNKVEISTETNLFKLLQAAKVVTSGFSGSIIEAGLLEIPTIINHKVGLETYKQLIDEHPNLYKYAETKDEFMNALSSFVVDKNSLSCTF